MSWQIQHIDCLLPVYAAASSAHEHVLRYSLQLLPPSSSRGCCLCCGWEERGRAGGGRHQPQIFFLSLSLILLLACLFLQAPIPRDSSNTNQTQLLCNTHIKKVHVLGLSSNKPLSCLESPYSPLTALLPVWPAGSYQLGQGSCRAVNPGLSRRTHPAIQPACSSR